jgi:hypothetical protein
VYELIPENCKSRNKNKRKIETLMKKLGAKKLGEGAFRCAYLFDNKYVVKLDKTKSDTAEVGNLSEFNRWLIFKKTPIRHRFNKPLSFCEETNTIWQSLVKPVEKIKKGSPILKRWRKKVFHAFDSLEGNNVVFDTHEGNIGWNGGRFVMIDYGTPGNESTEEGYAFFKNVPIKFRKIILKKKD